MNENSPKMDKEIIKKNFYHYKESKGLTWQDLTKAAGVKSYTQIINYLNKPGLTLASLEKLAAILNIEPWQLLRPQEATTKEHTIIICPHCGNLLSIRAAKVQTDNNTPNLE